MAKRMSKSAKKGHQRAKQTATQAHLDVVLLHAQQLLLQGNIAEATKVLEMNAGQLGRFAAYQAMMASCYGEAGRRMEAAEHARLALDLDPRNADYLLLAAISYLEAGYYGFAHRERQRWLRIGPHGPLEEEMARIEEAYHRSVLGIQLRYGLSSWEIAEQASYRLDEGRWALDHQRWEESLRHSRAATQLVPGWPPPRNNAAAALFYMRRYDEAIAESEAVLRECDPDNLHALSNLVQFTVTVRNGEAANRYADLLAQRPAWENMDDAIKAVEGLAFLDRDQDIARILQKTEARHGALPATLLVHQAIVEANAGKRKKALDHLAQAQAAGVDSGLLRMTLQGLQHNQPGPGISDRFPQTQTNQLIDHQATQELIEVMRQDEEQGRRDERRWERYLREYPQMSLVLRRMLYELTLDTDAVIGLLAALRTAEAVETLRAFGLGEKGSVNDRTAALRALQEIGELPPNAEVDLWIDGERRRTQLIQYEISELEPPDYPEAAWREYELAVRAHQAGQLKDAELHYRAMLEIEPRSKEAYNNLAGVYMQLGDEAQAEACLVKSLEIDPLYSFPRTTRAHQELARGDVEAAKSWLAPLASVIKWHPQAFSVYQKTMARIAIEQQDFEAAERHLQIAMRLHPTDEVRELLDRLPLLKLSGKFASRWREDADRYRQRRQKATLPADPTLADCFGLLTKGDLTGIRHVLRLQGSGLKKAELAKYIIGVITDPDFLARIVEHLSEQERAALRDLLEHGGVMDWQAFADAHGHDLEESPYLEYHAEEMEAVMGRLRARGLLFEGTAEGRLIVAVPRELRPLLQAALD